MVWPFFAAEESPAPADEVFECDYERDCSALYRAIESAIEPSEFAPIVTFLDTGYWPGSFFADSNKPADQARTWVTRFDPNDTTKVKWSQLPLHLAIVCNAPVSIIGRLVKLYPQALRCTDDQHMLPLHLALRHGASDEVVSYMLLQFPDAVNAKGKNGRTAIDCALRAKDKLRGKILEIFVEKNKGKKSAAIVKEQKQLKEELQVKSDEILELRADLEEMAKSYESIKELKDTVEMDLLKKIQDLEQAMAEQDVEASDKYHALQNEKLLESIEQQKKLEILDVTKESLETSEKHAREAEANLRKELETIHGRVAKSLSPDDWNALKTDVRGLEAHRLERSRTETKIQIDTLKDELEKTIFDIQTVESNVGDKGTKAGLRSDLKVIQQTVRQLEEVETSSKNKEELNAMRNEIDSLRAEIKERAEASRARVELTVLKKAMEIELRNAQGKTESELAALRKAVEAANSSKLETKTNAEVSMLKKELDSLKKEIRNKELVNKTKTELDDLCGSLDAEINAAGSKAGNSDLVQMKKAAVELKNKLAKSPASDDGIIVVNKSVKLMKEDLKKKETTSRIMEEVTVLKSAVETELKKAEGKTQEELLVMKQQIKSLTQKELSTKGVDELTKIKRELTGVKAGLKDIEKAAKVQQELDVLKATLAAEMKHTAVKAEQELAMMKKAVDEVNMEQKESKKLKKGLAEEIKEANKNTELKLLDLKKALDCIDVKKLESTNKDGWDAIRSEMDTLKAELAVKQASRDISNEVDYIKKTVEAFNLESIEKRTSSEFKSLRAEMDDMRVNLLKKDQGEAQLKRELETLKKTGGPKKKGLKKFFTRHFAHRKNNEVDPSIEEVKAALAAPILVTSTSASIAPGHSMVTEIVPSATSDVVTTIAPPSMVNMRNFGVGSDSDDSYSEDEESQANEDLLAKLSVSFIEDTVPAVETAITQSPSSSGNAVKTVSSTLSQQTPKSPIKATYSAQSQPQPTKASIKKGSLPPIAPSSMRKVHSMEPRIASPTSASKPSTMVRKFSKPIMETSGEVELEKVMSNASLEDEVLVQSPTSASVAAAQ